MTKFDKRVIDLYVAVGDSRMASLLVIAELHAMGEKVPEELAEVRAALRNAHEGLRPVYKRTMEKLFGDIPLS